MSYQVLARKWRPQVFDDVVGQGHITQPLQNAITSGRLAHAFLFSGPRGVGKTTTARILAKAINCAQGPTPIPCGKCDSCLETAAGNSVDVIEIDGASNRGIEHIRELREAVKYAPSVGKYKVYVIDEVHMLTNEAFNALLKTLEEPPPHVIFIFATTEPQKIPATIHSRCQHYAFKRISLREIIEQLRKIADSEELTISDQGLAIIARAAEGSMRDSQSLLDQAVSYSGKVIKDEDLQATLGSVAQNALLKFTASLLVKDAAELLKQVDELLEQGQDIHQFLSRVIEHLRNLMVIKLAKEPEQIVELPAADINALRLQAATAEVDQLLMLFDSLTKTLEEMRWSPHQRFTLEIGFIKACQLKTLRPLADIISQMKEIEERIVSTRQTATAHGLVADHVDKRKQDYTAKTSTRATAEPSKATLTQDDVWGKIMHAIEANKPNLAASLEHSKLLDVSDKRLVIGIPGSFKATQVEKRENRNYVEQVAEEFFKRKLQVVVQPLTEITNSDAKVKNNIKPKTIVPDPAIQDVLRVFTQGEVIEKNHSDEQ
ncbi:MAG TPA: DNA polymerase III subunit gamma/tau [Nitrospirota bacterium]|nr:DNA polymerase III subunit gamma/tau [Nitrospirota bacterium]